MIYSNLFIPSINALGSHWWNVSVADHSLIKYRPGVDSVISCAFGDLQAGYTNIYFMLRVNA